MPIGAAAVQWLRGQRLVVSQWFSKRPDLARWGHSTPGKSRGGTGLSAAGALGVFRLSGAADPPGARCARNVSFFATTIGADNPIPKEINHREVTFRIAVVDKMELLFRLNREKRQAMIPQHDN